MDLQFESSIKLASPTTLAFCLISEVLLMKRRVTAEYPATIVWI